MDLAPKELEQLVGRHGEFFGGEADVGRVFERWEGREVEVWICGTVDCGVIVDIGVSVSMVVVRRFRVDYQLQALRFYLGGGVISRDWVRRAQGFGFVYCAHMLRKSVGSCKGAITLCRWSVLFRKVEVNGATDLAKRNRMASP